MGDRLIRPLRALIKAARHPADKAVRVPVTTNDEIGRLSAAFNDLAEHRERLEEQVAAHRSAADLAGVGAVHRVHRRAGAAAGDPCGPRHGSAR
ncbi:HAMP domain-containing protein [Streptomyces zaomyceticus]|uniref:HAMP domain-containing protein n=1 Tax=Streptomyces zaomyceticus TaxID=68286 RepID=UPI0036B4D7BD